MNINAKQMTEIATSRMDITTVLGYFGQIRGSGDGGSDTPTPTPDPTPDPTPTPDPSGGGDGGDDSGGGLDE